MISEQGRKDLMIGLLGLLALCGVIYLQLNESTIPVELLTLLGGVISYFTGFTSNKGGGNDGSE